MADSLTVVDDIIDRARKIAKRGHRVPFAQTFDFVKSYCMQNVELNIPIILGACDEYDFLFRACGPIIRSDCPIRAIRVDDAYAMPRGKHWRNRPVFVASTDLGERIEAIIPSLVRIERPKIRKHIGRHVFEALIGDGSIEFDSGGTEGEVYACDLPSAVEERALRSNVIQGGSQVVGGIGSDGFEVGIEQLEKPKLINVFSFFSIWFNDYGPRIVGEKPLDSGLQFIDVVLCACSQ